MIRRYGEAVKPGISYRRRPGVYALLIEGDRILVTFQDSPVPEFQLPGGGIDKGEHPIAALHREVREETGWKIADPLRVGAFRRFTWMPEYNFWAEKICTIYLAKPVYRLSAPTESGHSAHWLPLGEAVELLGNAGDRGILRRVLRGK